MTPNVRRISDSITARGSANRPVRDGTRNELLS